jgi:hypothetical protein
MGMYGSTTYIQVMWWKEGQEKCGKEERRVRQETNSSFIDNLCVALMLQVNRREEHGRSQAEN